MRGLLLLLLAGCALQPRHSLLVAPDFHAKAPKRVAILLLENQSLDLLAPELLRRMAAERLGWRGYTIEPLAEVDEKLRTMGISDGGQLRAIKAQELGQILGTDGLLYGTIEDYNYTDIGFGNRKSVRLKWALVRSEDGEKLWESSDQESKMGIREDTAASKGFIEDTVKRAIENMRKKPLYEQSKTLMDRMFTTLPTR